MRYAAVLLFAFLLTPLVSAQSDDSVADAAKAKAQSKTHRVWDDDSIQTLEGDINVVGQEPAPKPGDPKKPAVAKPGAVFFKGTTIDGATVSSDSFVGKPVLVQYWATWCPHCRADQAAVDRIARSGVPVLAVDMGESEQEVRNYLNGNPRSGSIFLDKNSNLGALTTVKGVPTYLVIDGDGRIVGRANGEQGDRGLRSLLSKAAPAASSSAGQ